MLAEFDVAAIGRSGFLDTNEVETFLVRLSPMGIPQSMN